MFKTKVPNVPAQNPFTAPDPALGPPAVPPKPKVPKMHTHAKNVGKAKRSKPTMPKWKGVSNKMLGTTNKPEGGMPGC